MPKIVAKHTDVFGNVSYLSVEDGEVRYTLFNGIPYSLSNIAADAMALQLACEACATVDQLVSTISKHCKVSAKEKVEPFSPASSPIERAAPDMLAALKALLPEVDSEIEQRQTSGNDEYWEDLKALSDAGHAAVAKAEGRTDA